MFRIEKLINTFIEVYPQSGESLLEETMCSFMESHQDPIVNGLCMWWGQA